MQLSTFVFGSIALLIQQYADKYRSEDLSKTLTELEGDLSLPRIKNYDFIIGMLNKFCICFKINTNF